LDIIILLLPGPLPVMLIASEPEKKRQDWQITPPIAPLGPDTPVHARAW
jgi:hypothetical protein